MNITFPSNTKEIIDKIRGTIGRDITIYVTVSGIACSGCTLDPRTNTSLDPFCSICGGDYWLNTTSGVSYSGHVRWGKSHQPYRVHGGVIDEGDCKVTISYSDEALQHVQNSDYFVVDGIDLYMKNYHLKGVPNVNRIAITLLEDPAG